MLVRCNKRIVRLFFCQAGIFSFSGFLTAYAWGCASNYVGRKVRVSRGLGGACGGVSVWGRARNEL